MVARHAGRILRYKRDVLPEGRAAALDGVVQDLRAAVKSRDPKAVAAARNVVETEFRKVPGAVQSGWQENTEVIVVAIVIALGVRAYFLQPFRIPTSSMQPTLNGIIGHPTGEAPPNALVQIWQRVQRGRHYVNVRAERDDEILALVQRPKWGFLAETEVRCRNGVYRVAAERDTLIRDFDLPRVEPVSGRVQVRYDDSLPKPRRFLKAGQLIAVGYIETGDQVFVDKMSYHFLPPRRGEVFVFKTTGIDGIQVEPGMGSQHYIKRLAGLPGDELRIDPPNLFVNGQPAFEEGFRRVMTARNGYRGYGHGTLGRDRFGNPTQALLSDSAQRFLLPEGEYFALGDNSYFSYDSRGWGTVQERNLVGRGVFVYYPFNEHWGVIR